MNDAEKTGGLIGLNSIVALLLSLESKFYVLTTSSNWSRVINELRLARLDPECGGCTDMIDLVEGEFR